MSGSSKTANHCHSALKTLLDDLSSSQYGEDLNQFTTSLISSKKRHFGSDGDTVQDEDGSTTSKRQRFENTETESTNLQSQDRNQNPTEDTGGRSSFEPNLNFSSYMDSAPQFWDSPYASIHASSDQQAFTNDIFGRLSYENLLQYDEGFGTEFWESNPFPGT